MSKQIAIVYDVDQRLLIGAHQDEPGFAVVSVPDGHCIVVTSCGSFSWRVVPKAEAPLEVPATAETPDSAGDNNGNGGV